LSQTWGVTGPQFFSKTGDEMRSQDEISIQGKKSRGTKPVLVSKLVLRGGDFEPPVFILPYPSAAHVCHEIEAFSE